MDNFFISLLYSTADGMTLTDLNSATFLALFYLCCSQMEAGSPCCTPLLLNHFMTAR